MRGRVKTPWNWVGYVEIWGRGVCCFAWMREGWQEAGSDNLKWDCAIQANSSWLVFRSTPSFHSLVANNLNKTYTFYINIFFYENILFYPLKKGHMKYAISFFRIYKLPIVFSHLNLNLHLFLSHTHTHTLPFSLVQYISINFIAANFIAQLW